MVKVLSEKDFFWKFKFSRIGQNEAWFFRSGRWCQESWQMFFNKNERKLRIFKFFILKYFQLDWAIVLLETLVWSRLTTTILDFLLKEIFHKTWKFLKFNYKMLCRNFHFIFLAFYEGKRFDGERWARLI